MRRRRSAAWVPVILLVCSLPAAAQAPPAAPAPAGAAPVPTAAPPRVAVVPPVQPPVLSPQEQAALDQLLAAWEARNAAVSTWSCTFHKWEYQAAWSPVGPGGDRLAFTESTGELKYAAPDKGLFRIRESRQWNATSGRYEPQPADSGEHWVCNGESIYEFRHNARQLVETKLPPEMQGKAISDGPLPFVFGAKAETLKKRYWMRIITPPDVRDQIWLEALPRFQADAANFSKVELMLDARDLMPFAIQIHKPGGQDRDVYQFDPRTNIIDRGLDLIRDFAKPSTPLGYKYVLEDLRAQPGAPAPQAAPR